METAFLGYKHQSGALDVFGSKNADSKIKNIPMSPTRNTSKSAQIIVWDKTRHQSPSHAAQKKKVNATHSLRSPPTAAAQKLCTKLQRKQTSTHQHSEACLCVKKQSRRQIAYTTLYTRAAHSSRAKHTANKHFAARLVELPDRGIKSVKPDSKPSNFEWGLVVAQTPYRQKQRQTMDWVHRAAAW